MNHNRSVADLVKRESIKALSTEPTLSDLGGGGGGGNNLAAIIAPIFTRLYDKHVQ